MWSVFLLILLWGTPAQEGDWRCLRGSYVAEDGILHLSADTLLFRELPQPKNSLRVRGVMKLREAAEKPDARMAVVFCLSEPRWMRGRYLELAIDANRTSLLLVEDGAKRLLEEAPYGFTVGEQVPFVVGFQRSGGKDVLSARLFIRHTRVRLKHTIGSVGKLCGFGFLAFRCRVDVGSIACE